MVKNSTDKVEPLPPKPEGDSTLMFGAFIYPGMDLLDSMGVLRVFGEKCTKLNIKVLLVGETMDPVLTDQQVRACPDMTISEAPYLDFFFMPGGTGTGAVIDNKPLMKLIHKRIEEARWCLTVCTGASILAATGLADGRYATTNKAFWNIFIEYGHNVKWVKRARWVQDGKFVTSSGVSAGMDMAFYVVSQLYGEKAAAELAQYIEYTRHTDADYDPFCECYPDNRDAPLGVAPDLSQLADML
ncbi:hypothetical protein BGW41_004604 [Actinomortierella wolfii]|nr:hypothetical protein BGW41_004604 [Actinomortierella wolfii]